LRTRGNGENLMKEEIQKERRCNVNMMKEKEGVEKS